MAAAESDGGRSPDAWYAALADLAEEVVFVHREDRSIAFVSPSVEVVLGYTPEQFTAMSTIDLLHPDDLPGAAETAMWLRAESGRSYRSEVRIRHAAGHWIWAEIVGRNLLDEPDVEGVINTLRDISDRRAREARLTHEAGHDHLTALANRSTLHRALDEALSGDPAGSIVVLFLDLDGFKVINDTYGHAAGDELLKVVADRLRGVVRDGDLPARLAGDEFVVLCRGVSGDAQVIADRVHAAVSGPAAITRHQIDLAVSVGAARSSATSTGEELLAAADAALYDAKRRGGKRAVVAEP